MPLIEVHRLEKSYGGHRVLRGIDLAVEQGDIVGVLGPNGAGKTTLVECIGGLRRWEAGTVRVDGVDPHTAGPGFRDTVGMQLQHCRLPAKIRVAEALDLFASFYPDPVPRTELLGRFGLEGMERRPFDQLSGGQQQRLSVALALIGRPRIAILDELTTGLDPESRRRIWDHLTELRSDGVTMLLVTHSMEEAQYLCDRVVVIDDGVIAADGSPDALATATDDTETTFDDDLDGAGHPGAPFDDAHLDALRALPGVREVVRRHDGRIAISGDPDSPQAVLAHLTAAGIRAGRLRVSQPTLDDAYLRVVRAPRGEEQR
jgi:ABC-2 type transport system ATP-binding protein